MTVDFVSDLSSCVGAELGTSDWLRVDEMTIFAFAELTNDRHWIHTDPERARKEAQFGNVIAHGFLTLSFLTAMLNECVTIRNAERWINYGIDRLRFRQPVLPGDRLRLRATLAELSKAGDASRLKLTCTLELEGNAKPALTCDWTVLVFEAVRQT